MSADLQSRVRDAAPEPGVEFDMDAAMGRARQLVRRRTASVAASLLLALGGVGVAVDLLRDGVDDGPTIVDSPDGNAAGLVGVYEPWVGDVTVDVPLDGVAVAGPAAIATWESSDGVLQAIGPAGTHVLARRGAVTIVTPSDGRSHVIERDEVVIDTLIASADVVWLAGPPREAGLSIERIVVGAVEPVRTSVQLPLPAEGRYAEPDLELLADGSLAVHLWSGELPTSRTKVTAVLSAAGPDGLAGPLDVGPLVAGARPDAGPGLGIKFVGDNDSIRLVGAMPEGHDRDIRLTLPRGFDHLVTMEAYGSDAAVFKLSAMGEAGPNPTSMVSIVFEDGGTTWQHDVLVAAGPRDADVAVIPLRTTERGGATVVAQQPLWSAVDGSMYQLASNGDTRSLLALPAVGFGGHAPSYDASAPDVAAADPTRMVQDGIPGPIAVAGPGTTAALVADGSRVEVPGRADAGRAPMAVAPDGATATIWLGRIEVTEGGTVTTMPRLGLISAGETDGVPFAFDATGDLWAWETSRFPFRASQGRPELVVRRADSEVWERMGRVPVAALMDVTVNELAWHIEGDSIAVMTANSTPASPRYLTWMPIADGGARLDEASMAAGVARVVDPLLIGAGGLRSGAALGVTSVSGATLRMDGPFLATSGVIVVDGLDSINSIGGADTQGSASSLVGGVTTSLVSASSRNDGLLLVGDRVGHTAAVRYRSSDDNQNLAVLSSADGAIWIVTDEGALPLLDPSWRLVADVAG